MNIYNLVAVKYPLSSNKKMVLVDNFIVYTPY